MDIIVLTKVVPDIERVKFEQPGSGGQEFGTAGDQPL